MRDRLAIIGAAAIFIAITTLLVFTLGWVAASVVLLGFLFGLALGVGITAPRWPF